MSESGLAAVGSIVGHSSRLPALDCRARCSLASRSVRPALLGVISPWMETTGGEGRGLFVDGLEKKRLPVRRIYIRSQ